MIRKITILGIVWIMILSAVLITIPTITLPADRNREVDETYIEDDIDSNNIKVEKKVGSGVEDSELVEGIILDKERVHSAMPKTVKAAKIALIDAAIEIKDTETDAKIQITDPTQMQAFIEQEEKMIKDMIAKIVNSGANVVICQKGIDDIAQHYLAKHGIFAVRRIKKSDILISIC